MKIYELELNYDERRKFKELCFERMKEENMSIRDVAKATGYNYMSVAKFLSRNGDQYTNRYLAAKLFNLLDVKFNSWKD